jgi:hypothetical protein
MDFKDLITDIIASMMTELTGVLGIMFMIILVLTVIGFIMVIITGIIGMFIKVKMKSYDFEYFDIRGRLVTFSQTGMDHDQAYASAQAYVDMLYDQGKAQSKDVYSKSIPILEKN